MKFRFCVPRPSAHRMDEFVESIRELTTRFPVNEDDAALLVEKILAERGSPQPYLGVAINRRGDVYFFLQRLGAGTYGSVYSASLDGSRVAQFVVKQFSFADIRRGLPLQTPDDDSSVAELVQQDAAQGHDEYEFRDGYVETEFRISAFIAERLGERFCRSSVICALERFYSRDRKQGFIVFPFAGSMTLARYLPQKIGSAMLRVHKMIADANLFGQTIDTIRELARGIDSEAQDAARIVREVARVQDACLYLAQYLVQTLAELHSIGVIHNDLKPENILVENGTPKLIDFGISCAAPATDDVTTTDERYSYIWCGEMYETTNFVQDPLAGRLRAKRNVVKREMFTKFDTYSMGKLIQIIFDGGVYTGNGRLTRFPIVRPTIFMPLGLYELIVTMTGEFNYNPPRSDDGSYDLSLDPVQFAERLSRYQRRPSMERVRSHFDTIVYNWSNKQE